MTFRERNIVTYMITSLIVMGGYAYYLFGQFQAGTFGGSDASALVGKSVLVIVAASIVVNIVVSIIVAIVAGIATRATEIEKADERDKLVDLKGMQVSFITFSVLYLASMVALALEWAPHVVFLLILAAMFVASFVDGAVKLYLYRRGF